MRGKGRPETTKKGFRKNLTKVNNMQYWYINAHGLKKRGVGEMYSVHQTKSLKYLAPIIANVKG